MRLATLHRPLSIVSAIGLVAAVTAHGQAPAVPPPPAPGETGAAAPAGLPQGAEVLTRGPVHEAFAEPVVFNPQAGPVVQKVPPAPVEELPPDQKPEGQNVVWVAGYWSWDDDRDDFLWVSGIWRDLPPGRQWVPGYWNEVQGGVQWVAGYWASTEQAELEYLPNAPPQSLEVGPNTPAPDQNYTWAPGHWYWYEERYVWRPGYWVPIRTDWVWVPAHYVWTPAGYVFIDGYWDYAIADRGMMFAPVYFPPAVVIQPAFVYTPTVVIQNTVVVDHFFCRPAWNHYYFGDYYAPAYRQSGFFFALGFGSNGWGGRGFSFGLGVQRGFGGFYDPVVAQYAAVRSVTDITYVRRVEEVYRYREVNVDARPARTFLSQRERIGRMRDGDQARGRSLALGAPLAEVARARADMVGARADMVRSRSDAVQAQAAVRQTRLETINQAQRVELARRADSLRDFRRDRLQRETELARTRADIVGARQGAVATKAQADAAARAATAGTLADRAKAAGAAREAEAAARANRGPGAPANREAARSLRLPRSPIAAAPLPAEAARALPERPTPNAGRTGGANRPEIGNANRPGIGVPNRPAPGGVPAGAAGGNGPRGVAAGPDGAPGPANRDRPGRQPGADGAPGPARPGLRPGVADQPNARPDRPEIVRPRVDGPQGKAAAGPRGRLERPGSNPDRPAIERTLPNATPRPELPRPAAEAPRAPRPEIVRPRIERPQPQPGGAPNPNLTRPNPGAPGRPMPRIERPQPQPGGAPAGAGGDAGRITLPNRPGGQARPRGESSPVGERPSLTRPPLERRPIGEGIAPGRTLGDRSVPVRPGAPPAGWPANAPTARLGGGEWPSTPFAQPRPGLDRRPLPGGGDPGARPRGDRPAMPGRPGLAPGAGPGDRPTMTRPSGPPRGNPGDRPEARRPAPGRPNRERRPD